jgi:hypothetical protein
MVRSKPVRSKLKRTVAGGDDMGNGVIMKLDEIDRGGKK